MTRWIRTDLLNYLNIFARSQIVYRGPTDMDDQQPNNFSKGSEEEWARLLSTFNSSTNGLPGLDQDSAPVESHIASEGDGQPDATEASSNDVIRVSTIEQALRESHDQCLVKLLAAEPTTDGWMTYQELFKNLKRFISSIDSPKNKHACYLELYSKPIHRRQDRYLKR